MYECRLMHMVWYIINHHTWGYFIHTEASKESVASLQQEEQLCSKGGNIATTDVIIYQLFM